MLTLAAVTLGIHLASYHLQPELSGDQPYNDANPGLYLRTPAGWQVGTYWNSHRKVTLYGGRAFRPFAGQNWDAGAFLGVATGYPWGDLMPIGALSARYGFARLTATPRIGDKASATLHLSFEWELK